MQKFSEDYINFISALGREILPERYWWYTSLSSKNRFQSKLLPMFERLSTDGQTIEIPETRSLWFLIHFLFAEFFKSILCWTMSVKVRKSVRKLNEIYLFLSFSYPSSFKNGKYYDSYWGKLPSVINEKADVFVLVKPLGTLKHMLSSPIKGVAPLYSFISPISYFRVVFTFLKLRMEWRSSDETIKNLLREEVFNDSLFQALLMEEVCSAFFSMTKVKKILIPFEGNAWERAVVHEARKISPPIPVSGYVHTVIPEISTNLFPGRGEYERGPFPDEILVLGEAPKSILSEKGNFPVGILKSSCALRFESMLKLNRMEEVQDKTIIVILEGVLPAVKVVDFIIDQAPFLPEWNFRLRFHPALSWEKMKPFSKHGNTSFPPNVKISDSTTLYEAIRLSRLCLYWGSTAGIEALFLGRPIIHLDLGTILSYDPLFAHKGFHWKVGIDENLKPLVEAIESLSAEEKNKLYSDSIKYLKSYFGEITPEKLQAFF